MYTPRETQTYEKLIKLEYKKARGYFFKDVPITVQIDVQFEVPKNASKQAKEDMLNDFVKCTKKPDVDNIAKSILDALNDTAYADDSQVIGLIVTKKYGDKSKIKITIKDCI